MTIVLDFSPDEDEHGRFVKKVDSEEFQQAVLDELREIKGDIQIKWFTEDMPTLTFEIDRVEVTSISRIE